MLTRRDVLRGTAAAGVVAVLPIPNGAATVAPLPEALPAWGVGVDDGGHTIQFARTLHEAVMQHIDENCFEVCDACANGEPDKCEANAVEAYWCEYGSVQGRREPTLDHFSDAPEKIDNVTLRSIGWCVPCVRCEAADAYMGIDEYPSAYDTSVIDGEGVVCHECIEGEREFSA